MRACAVWLEACQEERRPLGFWVVVAWGARRFLPPYGERFITNLVDHTRHSHAIDSIGRLRRSVRSTRQRSEQMGGHPSACRERRWGAALRFEQTASKATRVRPRARARDNSSVSVTNFCQDRGMLAWRPLVNCAIDQRPMGADRRWQRS